MGRISDFWTPEREQILREHYPTITSTEICKLFGWDVAPIIVSNRASVLKIKKAPVVEAAGTTVKQCKGYRVVIHRMAGI